LPRVGSIAYGVEREGQAKLRHKLRRRRIGDELAEKACGNGIPFGVVAFPADLHTLGWALDVGADRLNLRLQNAVKVAQRQAAVMVFVPQLPARPFSRGKIVHHLRYSVHNVTVASASILLPSQQ